MTEDNRILRELHFYEAQVVKLAREISAHKLEILKFGKIIDKLYRDLKEYKKTALPKAN